MGSLSEFKSSEAERGLTSGGATLRAKSWSLHWWLWPEQPDQPPSTTSSRSHMADRYQNRTVSVRVE